jgi:hypothetical protein
MYPRTKRDLRSKNCKAELKFADLQRVKQVSLKVTMLIALRPSPAVLLTVLPMDFKDPEFRSMRDECRRF